MSGFALEQKFLMSIMPLIGLILIPYIAYCLGNNVKKNTGYCLNFRLLPILIMKVSKLYGMLQPGESETAAAERYFYRSDRKNKTDMYIL